MWYTTTSHHITSRHVTSRQITSHHSHVTSRHVTSHHITSHHITSHHITSQSQSHHITSRHVTSQSRHITSHHITSHHLTSQSQSQLQLQSHYNHITLSQPRRPRLESSLPWKPQISLYELVLSYSLSDIWVLCTVSVCFLNNILKDVIDLFEVQYEFYTVIDTPHYILKHPPSVIPV